MNDRNAGSRADVEHAGQGVLAELDEERGPDLADLIERHEHDIRTCILSLVPNWADAEDVFQETCLRLLEKQQPWDRPGSPQSFRAWAVTIAYYQVLTYRKTRGRERNRFSDLATELIKEQHSAASTGREQRLTLLAACVGKLDEEARKLLQLVYGRGKRLHTVAAKLGRTETSTYKLHSRIRLLLRACVERSLRAESYTARVEG